MQKKKKNEEGESIYSRLQRPQGKSNPQEHIDKKREGSEKNKEVRQRSTKQNKIVKVVVMNDKMPKNALHGRYMPLNKCSESHF